MVTKIIPSSLPSVHVHLRLSMQSSLSVFMRPSSYPSNQTNKAQHNVTIFVARQHSLVMYLLGASESALPRFSCHLRSGVGDLSVQMIFVYGVGDYYFCTGTRSLNTVVTEVFFVNVHKTCRNY